MPHRTDPDIPSDAPTTAIIPDEVMAPLREICLDYPEAEEALFFDHPTFKVRKKHFCMLFSGERGWSVFLKGAPGMQEAVVERDPERFFRPPYVGGKGWIGCWVEPAVAPDWDELEDLIDESYRLVAPKRLVAMLDPD